MCGINGLVSNDLDTEQRQAIVKGMNIRLGHRGPDNDGIWSGKSVTLGHRRLSIIDLSSESNQPFVSSDGRYIIIYNGELYNYRELKLELQRSAKGAEVLPYFFKTASDTEVVLAAYIRYGKKCLDLFNGMYAFAIFDNQENKLFIGRDRLGVKPLYYYYGEEGFIFSSEIRPIIHSGIRKFRLNKEVLAEYTMYQTVYAPNTIVKGIKMLQAGYYLEYSDRKANLSRYYQINDISRESDNMSYQEVNKKVYELLSLSVQRRLISDVPFGAFLSGGIDSSIIVGLMSQTSQQKIQTFHVSFDEGEFSESNYAKIVAKKFNTQHHEIKLKPSDFIKQLPEALSAMDHPSGDGPNTYIVSKATKNAGITMALSGIGGDELFAGYDVFKRMHDLQNKSWLNAVPLFARRTLALAIQQKKTISRQKIADLIKQPKINFRSAYPLNRSLFNSSELKKLLLEPKAFDSIDAILAIVPQTDDHLLSAVSLAEINTYLQNILLRDTDQMSMAVALEVREPFLDHNLISFVLSIKDNYKYPHSPKRLLVDSVGDLVPSEIVNRKKMGFVLPWQLWLKSELKTFCESNIKSLESRSLFCNNSIYNLWDRFIKNDPTVNWSRIWHLVVLNQWITNNGIYD